MDKEKEYRYRWERCTISIVNKGGVNSQGKRGRESAHCTHRDVTRQKRRGKAARSGTANNFSHILSKSLIKEETRKIGQNNSKYTERVKRPEGVKPGKRKGNKLRLVRFNSRVSH